MIDTLKLWAAWARGDAAAYAALCAYFSRTAKARYRSLDEWEKGRM